MPSLNYTPEIRVTQEGYVQYRINSNDWIDISTLVSTTNSYIQSIIEEPEIKVIELN